MAEQTVDSQDFAAFQAWQKKQGEKKAEKEAKKIATKAIIAAHQAEYDKLVKDNS